MQIKLTRISYIEALFEISFIQNSGLFRVGFRQFPPYFLLIVMITAYRCVDCTNVWIASQYYFHYSLFAVLWDFEIVNSLFYIGLCGLCLMFNRTRSEEISR